ncbi:glycosyltransferase [Elongatibacter sediminis]|uniref:Glycosyltransferase n=1 Tax=Elongatibacter sediminis TaxID=3119006 RepID=A0AAW9RJR5_9GAMM
MSISVIVPFYNEARHIEHAIRGLLCQVDVPEGVEIILVDNNSNDGSREIANRFSEIKVISEAKQSSYAARNRGVREATGDVIAFMDADCVPAPDWLQQIDQAMSNSDALVVIGSRQSAGDSTALSSMAAYELEKSRYVFTGSDKELFYGYTNNMAVRKQVFGDLGPFLERSRGSDTILIRKLVDKYDCDSVLYVPEIKIRHLEINSLGRLYKKNYIYGRSRRRYNHIVRARPLSTGERLMLFRRAVRTQKFSPLRAAGLFTLLSLGLVYWVAGSVSALLKPDQDLRQRTVPRIDS